MEQVTSGASEVQSHWENRKDRKEPMVLKVPSLISCISTNWFGTLFMCQLDWATQCPDMLLNIISDVSMRVFLDEI